MKKIITILCLAIITAMVFVGCGNSYKGYDSAKSVEIMYDNAVTNDSASADAGLTEEGTGEATTVIQGNQKLIKTVNIDMQTKEYEKMLDGLNKEIANAKGYIENSEMYGNEYYNEGGNRSCSFVIRVPKDNLDSFLSVVGGLGNITRKNERVENVTLQYVDTESRVTALKTEQTRLLELLEKAESLEDIITIEGRLSEVRYQLESYASQLRALDNKIDYSTVEIYIREVERVSVPAESSIFQKMGDEFLDTLDDIKGGLADLSVFLVAKSPYIIIALVIALIVFLAIRSTLKKNKKAMAMANAKATANVTAGQNIQPEMQNEKGKEKK